ncbi:MAG: hypothetical protein AAF846_17480 [Chloroflexota bacterium]
MRPVRILLIREDNHQAQAMLLYEIVLKRRVPSEIETYKTTFSDTLDIIRDYFRPDLTVASFDTTEQFEELLTTFAEHGIPMHFFPPAGLSMALRTTMLNKAKHYPISASFYPVNMSEFTNNIKHWLAGLIEDLKFLEMPEALDDD